MDPKWKHPFSAVVSGPSGSGKSVFILNFIENLYDMCNSPFSDIYWHYGNTNPPRVNLPIKFHKGLPDLEEYYSNEPKLVIIDDLMREADFRVVDIFTKGCHHGNMSVFFTTQNLFHQGRGQRDISLNAHYIICFKNPRDKAQIRHLAHQVFNEKPLFIQEAYNDATSNSHGYLLLDMKQDTPDDYRFRTCIFPSDKLKFVYVPRK